MNLQNVLETGRSQLEGVSEKSLGIVFSLSNDSEIVDVPMNAVIIALAVAQVL
jgi:hypothetical protein